MCVYQQAQWFRGEFGVQVRRRVAQRKTRREPAEGDDSPSPTAKQEISRYTGEMVRTAHTSQNLPAVITF